MKTFTGPLLLWARIARINVSMRRVIDRGALIMSPQKYIRFVSPYPCRWIPGAQRGFFYPAYCLRDGMRPRGGEVAPDWLRGAIGDEIAWFCDYLDAPDRFGVVTRKSPRAYGGICWFRDDAHTFVSHAHALAALITEAGVPIERVEAARPGTIVFRDNHQIVAIPPRDGVYMN